MNYDFDNINLVQINDQLPFWSAPFALKLLNIVDYKPEILVLDVGCGTGFLSIELAQRLDKKSTIFALDISENSLQRLKDKIKIIDINNIKPILGDIQNLNFENNYFDLLVSNNGINNAENIKKAISECSRVLKPSGQFIVTQNLPDTMYEFYDIYRDVLSDFNLDDEFQLLENHIFNKRKPVEALIKYLHNNNLIINSVCEDKFFYRFVNADSLFDYHEIKFYFSKPWFSILKDEFVDSIFTEIKTRLNKIAEKKGYIELTIPFICVDCRKNK
jgi:ubiquinone/menaquinone biosynthesis C-methylase UbiE